LIKITQKQQPKEILKITIPKYGFIYFSFKKFTGQTLSR